MAQQVTRSLNMSGIWWLPGKCEDRMIGTLTWMPNRGCELKLIDESHNLRWDLSAGIILGLNSDQKPVTLIGCKYAGRGGLTLSGKVQSFGFWVRSKCALIGHHVDADSGLDVRNVHARYAGLDEYVTEEYYDYELNEDEEGTTQIENIRFNIPEYESTRIGDTEVTLGVGFTLGKELRLQHELHFSFSAGNPYESEGDNLRLVHDILPEFLGILMGHQSFITGLTSSVGYVPIELFDGYSRKMSWDGEPDVLERLVWGNKETLDLWPSILASWVHSYDAVEKLSRAYIKILADGSDGFFEFNNLVHIFFGLEAYHKAHPNVKSSSTRNALEYAITRIRSYFEDIKELRELADSIDCKRLSWARQILVHANEGESDFALVYHQLIFIARSVLLMEMEYPVTNVRLDTDHWRLWRFFENRREKSSAE